VHEKHQQQLGGRSVRDLSEPIDPEMCCARLTDTCEHAARQVTTQCLAKQGERIGPSTARTRSSAFLCSTASPSRVRTLRRACMYLGAGKGGGWEGVARVKSGKNLSERWSM
jgi:ribosomal protein L16/L10AE